MVYIERHVVFCMVNPTPQIIPNRDLWHWVIGSFGFTISLGFTIDLVHFSRRSFVIPSTSARQVPVAEKLIEFKANIRARLRGSVGKWKPRLDSEFMCSHNK